MNQPRTCVLDCRDRDGYARRASPGLLVCSLCSERLRKTVDAIERTYLLVTQVAELIPGGRGGDGVRRVPGPRSPAVDAIIAHTDRRSDDGAVAVIEAWARWVRAERSLDTEPAQMLATVPAGRVTMYRELATLRFHWDWLMGSEQVEEFAEALTQVYYQLRRTRGELDKVTRVGKCPTLIAVTDEVELRCGAWLSVKPRDSEIRCRNCGTIWPRDRWEELGDTAADYATLSKQFGVPVGTLRRWASEDGWTKSGERGRPLLNRDEVRASYLRRRGLVRFDEAG